MTIEQEIFNLHFTDSDNAKALAMLFGDELRYVHQIGWHIWDRKRWRPDKGREVNKYARKLAKKRQNLVLSLAAADDSRDDMMKKAFGMENAGKIANILKMAESTAPFSTLVEDVDNKPLVIVCSNGTLYLEIPYLTSADPDDLITMNTDVPYNPNAKSPRWNRFLEEVFVHPDQTPDLELIAYMKKALGMALTGKTERVIFLCYGGGSNGKSTLFKILQHVLGDYAASASFNSLVVRNSATGNELARLRSKRLVTAIETEESQYLNEAKVKMLTGGDAITCRFLYQEHFEYYPEFKLWLAVNHKPRIRGTDEAIWDRVKLIPFNARFEGAADDKDLLDKLKAESEGILAWMVEGCNDWLDSDRHLVDCKAVQDASHEYRIEEDAFKAFLDDKVEDFPGNFLTVSELTREYNQWAKNNNEKTLTSVWIGRKMKERGYKQHRKGGKVRGYWGLAIQ